MHRIEKLLEKRYYVSLWKNKTYKKEFKKYTTKLKEAKISYQDKDEFSFYEAQLLYETIKIKEKFEEVFFRTYIEMYDYWKDIEYLERKHQMNVDINRLLEELKMFTFDKDSIYMPACSPFLNRIYEKEIVLLDLKQYARFIRDYDKETSVHYYGYLPYLHGFTKAKFLLGDMDDFCVYDDVLKRVYRIVDGRCSNVLYFKKHAVMEKEELSRIVYLWLTENEIQMINELKKSELIDDKMKRKLIKLKFKIEKKLNKKGCKKDD